MDNTYYAISNKTLNKLYAVKDDYTKAIEIAKNLALKKVAKK